MIISLNSIRDLSKVFLTGIFLFFYVYTPNLSFLPFSVDKILLLIALIWVLLKRRTAFIEICNFQPVTRIILLFLFISVYTIVMDAFVMDGFGLSYHVLLYLVQYIPFSIAIYLYVESYAGDRTTEIIIKTMIVMVGLQSLLGYLMFFNPDLKAWVYSIQSRV